MQRRTGAIRDGAGEKAVSVSVGWGLTVTGNVARLAGLVAGPGLLLVAASGHRWVTGSMRISARYYWVTLILFAFGWWLSRRLPPRTG